MKTFLARLLTVVLLFVSVCALADNPDDRSPLVQKDYLNSIKLTFLSWISGSTKLSYERAFPAWKQSGELCASLIKAGYVFALLLYTCFRRGQDLGEYGCSSGHSRLSVCVQEIPG